MGKIVGWIIAIGVILLVVYALKTGLITDVQHPFTPPPHP